MKRFCICAVVLFTATSLYAAADLSNFSIYGSVKTGLWWDRYERVTDDTLTINQINDTLFDTIVGKDPKPYNHFTLLPYGNLGIKYKGDRVGVTFDLGVSSAVKRAYLTGVTGIALLYSERYFAWVRHFFAEVYLNDFLTLLIGQDFAPTCFITTSNQVYYGENSFLNTGSLYTGRKPMIEFIVGNLKNNPTIGFEAKVAALIVDTCSVQFHQQYYPLTNTKLPKLEGGGKIQINSGSFGADLNIVGGYQLYELVLPNEFDPKRQWTQPVNCFVFGAHAGVKVSVVSLKGDFATGKNWGPYGVYIGNPFQEKGVSTSYLTNMFYPIYSGSLDSQNVTQYESKTTEADVVLNVKPAKWLSFEGGFGFVHASHGDTALSAKWHDTYAGYFQAELTAWGFLTFTPEGGFYFYGPKKGYGRLIYWGLGTRVDF